MRSVRIWKHFTSRNANNAPQLLHYINNEYLATVNTDWSLNQMFCVQHKCNEEKKYICCVCVCAAKSILIRKRIEYVPFFEWKFYHLLLGLNFLSICQFEKCIFVLFTLTTKKVVEAKSIDDDIEKSVLHIE